MGTRLSYARRWSIRWFLAAVSLAVLAAVAWAQSPTIVSVEEDWELVIGTPAPERNAPQITTVISPLGHVESFHATLDLNSHTIPTFAPGGVQFEVWEGDVPLLERKFPNQSLLATPGETIRWTQSMKLNGRVVSFEIVNGSSTTWGSFGGQGYLKDSVVTTVTDLNGYSPEVSVQNSGVGYAANRVESLILKTVRLHTSTGEVIEDSTPRVVHSRN